MLLLLLQLSFLLEEAASANQSTHQDSMEAGDPPECSFQPVLGVGQQAKVWGDQLEAGKAQQAVQVEESHAPPACEAPQLPAEPGDIHHWLHLPQHVRQVRCAAYLHGQCASDHMRVICIWDVCTILTEAAAMRCWLEHAEPPRGKACLVLDNCAPHGFAMLA